MKSEKNSGTLYEGQILYQVKKGQVMPLQARCGPEGG